MRLVVFLASNKVGPSNLGLYVRGMPVGGPNHYTGKVKNRINRRGESGEGRERQGDCTHGRAVLLFVVQVFH